MPKPQASARRVGAGGLECKARNAMHAHQRAPQTRSTATALVSALRGKQSGSHTELPRTLAVPQVLPNPSLKLTRYGMQRKPGVRRLRHLRTPGLHCMPTRAA
jgi:hypothetical protein